MATHTSAITSNYLCRFNAKRASLVQSRIKQLERLPELKPVEKETEVTLKFPDVEKLSPPILMLSEVSFAYTNDKGERGPTVFSKVRQDI